MVALVFVLAVVAGLANPLQSATNAELHQRLGAPISTALVVYASGFCGLLILQAFVREPMPWGNAARVPWWAWAGGLVSLLPTVTGLLLTQKLGSGTFTAITITAAIVCSVVLDNFGWLGLHKHAASPLRMFGCALLVGGVWFVAKF